MNRKQINKKELFVSNMICATLSLLVICGGLMALRHYPTYRDTQIVMPEKTETYNSRNASYEINPNPQLDPLSFHPQPKIDNKAEDLRVFPQSPDKYTILNIFVYDRMVFYYEVAHYLPRPQMKSVFFGVTFPEIKLNENDIKTCSFEQIPNLLLDFKKKRDYNYDGKELTMVLFDVSDHTKYGEFINLLDDFKYTDTRRYAVRYTTGYEIQAINKLNKQEFVYILNNNGLDKKNNPIENLWPEAPTIKNYHERPSQNQPVIVY